MGADLQLLSSTPFGYLSDTLGRKRMYLVACLGTAAGVGLLGLEGWGGVPLLFAARALCGMSKHTTEATNALIVDYTQVRVGGEEGRGEGRESAVAGRGEGWSEGCAWAHARLASVAREL